MYGRSNSFKVQRLPFGLYLKQSPIAWHTSLVNEFEALRSVQDHVDLPTPSPMDILISGPHSYLVTSRVPGSPLGFFMHELSDESLDSISRELQHGLKQLRAIPKTGTLPPQAISNVMGGPCFDFRINAALPYEQERGDFVGPFPSETEFNKALKAYPLPDLEQSGGHDIVLTHGDINMRNVLVQDGKLSGIVDWETAGWYPTYWEYTKACFATRITRRWIRETDRIFAGLGDFSSELEVERQLWEYCF